MTPAHSRSALLAFWRTYGLALLLAFASLLAVRPAHAQLRVDISGTGATQYPVAIADFAVDDAHGRAPGRGDPRRPDPHGPVPPDQPPAPA